MPKKKVGAGVGTHDAEENPGPKAGCNVNRRMIEARCNVKQQQLKVWNDASPTWDFPGSEIPELRTK